MIKKYLRKTFYLTLCGGAAITILKDEKIIDYCSNVLEKYTSKFIENPNNYLTIDEEKSYIKLLVTIIFKKSIKYLIKTKTSLII